MNRELRGLGLAVIVGLGLITLLSSGNAGAQQVENAPLITGVVLDRQTQPVQGVVVAARPSADG